MDALNSNLETVLECAVELITKLKTTLDESERIALIHDANLLLSHADELLDELDLLVEENQSEQQLQLGIKYELVKQARELYRESVLEDIQTVKERYMEKSLALRGNETAQQNLETICRDQDRLKTNTASASSVSPLTLAMQRLHNALSSELEKSAQSNELLAGSSQIISKVTTEYFSMDSLVFASRNIVRSLKAQDSRDRNLILLALGIFGLTIVWIIYRRVVRRFLKLLIAGVNIASTPFKNMGKLSDSIPTS